MSQEEYYKVCVRHLHRKEYAVLLWGPNNQGYTTNLDGAGRYTAEECKDYFNNKDDFAVPCNELDMMSIKMEYRIESDRWLPYRIVLNNSLFWDLYGINEKRLHFARGDVGDVRYWRYPKREPVPATV